ncbi:MAG: Crp/Fnr family transcriptional regulator [Ideonella sp.]|nr:Crp/Fnr family transcriptional regulator [Ideonella sp.]
MSIDTLLDDGPVALPQAPHASAQDHGSGCFDCPLRRLPLFQPVNQEELSLIASLKRGQIERDAGRSLIDEGESDGPLMTLLDGWAFRFKTLPDGRRQILNFLLPGDFVGLQQKMTDAASHGVESLTRVRLCSFQRNTVWTLHREQPSLGYDVTWLAAHEEALVDGNLLSVGRRSARERIASVLLVLHARASVHEVCTEGQGVLFPVTQQHLADALGLSLVHTNKTMRRLVREGLCVWQPGPRLLLPDPAALARVAHLEHPVVPGTRPLI